jgi:hypothetical protein
MYINVKKYLKKENARTHDDLLTGPAQGIGEQGTCLERHFNSGGIFQN